jgi:long-chain acyl-CoA synthetase
MNDRFWVKNYPPGVPADINPAAHSSLKEMIELAIGRFRDRPAYTSMDRTITYGELDKLSREFAAYLQKVAGLRHGDRIAIMLPNLLQYPVAILGAFRAGLTIVNTNPLYTPRELEHQLKDSGARAILILENFCSTLQQVIEHTPIETVIVTGVGDLLGFPKSALVNFVLRHVKKQVPEYSLPESLRFHDALAKGRYENLEPIELGHEDIAFLQYTGGTTGVSKGAMLTHRNIVANILQSEAWIGPLLKQVDKPLTVITALPLYHIFALTGNCLLYLRLGSHNVLIANPRDFPTFVKELAKYPFNYISGVNTLFNALLNTPGFDKVDFSHLKVTLGGGMAVQRAVAERWKQVTGNTLSQAWGLTETSPAACINPPDVEFNGSIGLPISSTEITIRDDAGNALAIGERGEICVRGPQVMRGYWQRDDETAKVMLGDWLRTGDIGYINEQGFVYIEDRKKDMILVSGFNVYPNEVEDVIARHPGVLEVAAVAQADERAGEVVAVFIVRKDPSLTETQLIEYCKTQLTGYKVPKKVYFRDELPKTNVGKILRRELRDQLHAKA